MEDVVFLVLAEGFDFSLKTTVLDVEIDLSSEWETELNVSIVTGNVALVIERSDKADLSLSAGRVDELNISGNVDGFWDGEWSLHLLLLVLFLFLL